MSCHKERIVWSPIWSKLPPVFGRLQQHGPFCQMRGPGPTLSFWLSATACELPETSGDPKRKSLGKDSWQPKHVRSDLGLGTHFEPMLPLLLCGLGGLQLSEKACSLASLHLPICSSEISTAKNYTLFRSGCQEPLTQSTHRLLKQEGTLPQTEHWILSQSMGRASARAGKPWNWRLGGG